MNDTAPGIGHNAAAMTPFDAIVGEISDLHEEAAHWLDGEPIASQEVADAVAKLMDRIRAAHKRADALRKDEVKPLDDAKKEIQARYKPHLERADHAVSACKSALAPWLRKLEDERRAEAERARAEAEEKRRAAVEAIRESRGDLLASEAAEAQLAEAKRADKDASKIEKARPQAKGGVRAATLRKRYVAVITDETEFAKWVWTNHRPELTEFLQNLAQRKVNDGMRSMPGVRVLQEETVV